MARQAIPLHTELVSRQTLRYRALHTSLLDLPGDALGGLRDKCGLSLYMRGPRTVRPSLTSNPVNVTRIFANNQRGPVSSELVFLSCQVKSRWRNFLPRPSNLTHCTQYTDIR